jgi:thiol-disulfide isomerase/thioredoxin
MRLVRRGFSGWTAFALSAALASLAGCGSTAGNGANSAGNPVIADLPEEIATALTASALEAEAEASAADPAVKSPESGDPATAPAESPAEEPATNEPPPVAAEEPTVAAVDPLPATATEPASTEPAAAEPTASEPDQLAQAGSGDTNETPKTKSRPAKNKPPLDPANPFRQRIPVDDFPKDLEWLNSKPLTKADLKGKFVLLDFWTYCCINCMHILPELKKLEEQYPNELVVIGVHSAKFDTEKLSENIREAILRYEIVHPVINDADHKIWDDLGVSSWPTILMIDPEGNAVWGRQGEFKSEEVNEILKVAVPYYRDKKLLDETPLKFELETYKEDATPLRFPGKILADEKGNRLFISDSNHNRIVIATLDGQMLDVIGKGDIGREDGDYQTATFNHPQGCALLDETLYVADTENHLLRKVNLRAKSVTTIAGTGKQAEHAWPGLEQAQVTDQIPERWVGPPMTTGINSPWALWIHMGDLYIAMAGPHQIWRMPLTEKEIGPYAGNGREDIVDGPLLPKVPYAQGYSSFAQPSGLSSDGTWLYVADSEGSSIRAVPFDPKKNVKTVLGTDNLQFGRLFAFGDKDGPKRVAKLQHCLEVVYHEGKIYVADTYNHKIKIVDAKTGDAKTLAGTGKPGTADEPAQFHEPAGLALAGQTLYVADTNNHLIRTIDLKSGQVITLEIAGLAPSAAATAARAAQPVAAPATTAAAPKKPSFKGAHQEKIPPATVKPADGAIELHVSLKVPEGWKINQLAPMSYWLDSPRESGAADRAAFGRTKLAKPVADFEVPVKIGGEGEDEVQVSLAYQYCKEGDDGICKFGAVVFTVPLTIAADGKAGPIQLDHEIVE